MFRKTTYILSYIFLVVAFAGCAQHQIPEPAPKELSELKQEGLKKAARGRKLLASAQVAYKYKKYQKAIQGLNLLLKNDHSPYWFDARFLRAAALRKVGKPKKALDDYANIAMANLLKNYQLKT